MPKTKTLPRTMGYASLGLAGAGLASLLLARRSRSEPERRVQSATVRRSPDEVAQFWRANFGSSARVRFQVAPGGRGTEIHLEADEPDLRQVKQMLETGEVIRSSATLERADLLQRPAQPVEARA
jgi:hypothetical protein